MEKTIMLVEDDQDILDMIYYILTDEGYRVVRSTGTGVPERLLSSGADLVLMDHRLQVCWGADICRALKDNPATRHIPVVMMSATMGLNETAKKAGADAVLPKPFDIADLLAIVADHIRN